MFWPLKFLYSPKENQSHYIKDTQGRIIIYHGANLSNYAKHSSNIPGYFNTNTAGVSWHTLEDIQRLNTWGFNLVRYLVFWEALEPEKGVYNTEYINKTHEKLRLLRDCNIDVLLDFHQDLYAQKFTGEGFPEWTINDENNTFERQEPWNKNYFQPAVKASYKNFWRSTDLQKYYAAALAKVVMEFSGYKNVIGIDVMNEPIPILPKFLSFESGVLSNFYDKLYMVLHRYNPRMRMFYEPWMSTSTGIPTNLTFKPRLNCVLSPHYYDYWCETNEPYKAFNKWWMKRAFEIKVREAQKYQTPLLYGEFGFPSNAPGYLDGMEDFLNLADKYAVGWTYWSYDITPHNDRGFLNADKSGNDFLKKLVRIYPQRIAGDNPTYSMKDGKFSLYYDKTGASGNTEIFIPNMVFFEVEQSTGTCTYDTTTSRLLVENGPGKSQYTVLKYSPII